MTNDKKKIWLTILLLDEMSRRDFGTILKDDDSLFDEQFVEMRSKGFIDKGDKKWIITEKGNKFFDDFMQKYDEYLKIFDIFSYVDMKEGEFAFEKYYDLSDSDWELYKNNERFQDVRIAVCNFKKIDPEEIVFMSFINENRFDTSENGWQHKLMFGETWNEIEKIVSSAITVEEIGIEETKEMIKRGSEITKELLEKERELKTESVSETVTETTYVEETEYYDSYSYYSDPFYISPIWLIPLIW